MRDWLIFGVAVALLLFLADRDCKRRERLLQAGLRRFLDEQQRAAGQAPDPVPALTAVELGMLNGGWWWAYCVLVAEAIENGVLRHSSPDGPPPRKWAFVPQPGRASSGWVEQARDGVELWRGREFTDLPLAEVEASLVARGFLRTPRPETRWHRMTAAETPDFPVGPPAVPSRLLAAAVVLVAAAALTALAVEQAWVRAAVLLLVFLVWSWGQFLRNGTRLATAKTRQTAPAVTGAGADAMVRVRLAAMVREREQGTPLETPVAVAVGGWHTLERVHPGLADDLKPPQPDPGDGVMMEAG